MAEEVVKPEDFSYDTKTFAREAPDHELPAGFAPLYHSFAFESHKRSNLHYLDEDATLIFAAGGVIHFLDLHTMTSSYLPSLGGNEVGCIEVHQERNLICVAEKGIMPNVFIYEYPSLSLIRVLKGGTERAYSAANFSADGHKLATVGSFPDYMLTVWDWNNERIILRTKAFAQEVYRVRFSPRFEGQLVTSGTGHIRFWRMAQTFTGLKLQGDIGKFGQIELSDIEGYCELPDGKILSGSDWGNLLLWEGNLIKCEIRHSSGTNCHAGAIRSVALHGVQVITGGNDGYVRSWPVVEIEAAEPTDENPMFGVANDKEVCLLDMEGGRDEAKVQTMLRGEDHWLVQDSSGGIYKVNLQSGAVKPLFYFHSGGINGLDLCPFNHAAATCGADGSVRLWDYVSRATICTYRSGSAAVCISWAARAVDPEGRTLCVGYADGVLRVLTRCRDGLLLKNAFKPHAVALSAIAYSPDGNYLATGAADGTIFFFAVSRGNYSPVGFMKAPSTAKRIKGNAPKVTVLVWSSEETLCAGYSDGTLAELQLPSEPDTSETYELPFEGTAYDQIPIIEARRAVIKAARAAEAAKVAPPPASADGELAPAGTEEGDKEEDPIIDLDAGGVKALLPMKGSAGEPTAFYVSYANEEGLIWKGAMGTKEASSFTRHDRGSIVYIRLSRSGTMLLSGSSDGSICVGEVGSDAYWQGRVHGASPNVQPMLSFDDAYLVSAGGDGNLFVHKIATADPKEAILSAIGLPEVKDSGPNAPDITDKATYSIEEAKQKEESDARAAQADDKKLAVRGKVDALRARFGALLAENMLLPAAERLPREAFYIDPGLQSGVEMETISRLEEARGELAWISEKSEKSKAKLQAHFLNGLAIEAIALYGFANGRCVRSFRSVELDTWQKEAIEHVHALIEKEAKSRQRATQRKSGDGKDDGGGEGEGEEDLLGSAHDLIGNGKEKLSKMQERLLRRQQRAKEWAEFNATKPDDKYEDPVDVAAIQYGESHMGDFSLKTDGDYVVPEAQRVNAQKKRRQIVLLDESIHEIKMGFNERFLALRDLKQRILASMAVEDARLQAIDEELGLSESLEADLVSPGGLVAEEQPEVRSSVTAEQLEDFRAKQAAAKAKASGGMGGMGGGMSGKQAGGEEASASIAARAKGKPSPSHGKASQAASSEGSSLAKAEAALTRERLHVEKVRLIERRRATIRSFDEAVSELRAEKLRLEADLKTTDLRKLVLFEELTLLKEFEKKDTTLAKRLEMKINEKSEIVGRVAECQEKLTQKKAEIERLLERDRQIMSDFQSALGDGNKFYDQLLKIFKRKMKRKRQVADGGEEEDDDEEEEDEDEDDDDDLDDDDEEEEACPAGCDAALYEKVCELRERRLEQEDVYTEFQKGVEGLKKENEMLVKKEKSIDKALKDTEADIQSFQTEKQGKLNELHVVVTLRMSQVKHVVDNKLPSDLSEDLVFPAAELQRLRTRIRQLSTEKGDLRKRQKVLRNEHVTLHREQAVKQDKLRELDARLRDVQMLKFGQVIDLERIESVGVNKAAEELTERIRSVERGQDEALTGWKEKLKRAKAELKDATNDSTSSLNTVAALFERQHALETSLNSKQAAVAPREIGVERTERTSLVQLVKIQAKEVEALKLEINMLRRKGGHIYTGAK